MSNANDNTVDFSKFNLPPLPNKQDNVLGEKGGQQRKTNQVWLNVGISVELEPGKRTLLSLPLGIPMDEMEAASIPKDKDGKNPLFKHQRIAEAALLMKVKEIISNMKPGDRVLLQGFSAELYHVEPKEELSSQNLSANPFMSALGNVGVVGTNTK